MLTTRQDDDHNHDHDHQHHHQQHRAHYLLIRSSITDFSSVPLDSISIRLGEGRIVSFPVAVSTRPRADIGDGNGETEWTVTCSDTRAA